MRAADGNDDSVEKAPTSSTRLHSQQRIAWTWPRQALNYVRDLRSNVGHSCDDTDIDTVRRTGKDERALNDDDNDDAGEDRWMPTSMRGVQRRGGEEEEEKTGATRRIGTEVTSRGVEQREREGSRDQNLGAMEAPPLAQARRIETKAHCGDTHTPTYGVAPEGPVVYPQRQRSGAVPLSCIMGGCKKWGQTISASPPLRLAPGLTIVPLTCC